MNPQSPPSLFMAFLVEAQFEAIGGIEARVETVVVHVAAKRIAVPELEVATEARLDARAMRACEIERDDEEARSVCGQNRADSNVRST